MFRKICGQLGAIRIALEQITEGLRAVSEAQHDAPMSEITSDRLSTLEGGLERVIGQIDAGILKAESLKSAARASEERAKGTLKRAEQYAEIVASGESSDPFEQAAREQAHELPEGNDVAGEGVFPLPHGVESRRESLSAIRSAKRGR